jgi:predicted transcriptional regulator of viral defense system
MQENNYLTRREQLIFDIIRETDIISIHDIKDMFPEISQNMRYKILSSLNSKGYIFRLEKGLYLVQKTPSKEPIIEDPYRLALSMFNGYIAFSSALRLYNLIEYEPFTIFVATPNQSKRLVIGNYELRAVSMRVRAEGISLYNGIYMSNLEKTIFDCFYKPQYSGGYETITKALATGIKLNWKNVLYYFKKYSSDSLCQRTGYILDLMRTEIDYNVADYCIRYFRNRTKSKTKLIPTAPTKGKYSSKWKLMDNLGESTILGWLNGA